MPFPEVPRPQPGAGVPKLVAFNQLRCPLPNFSAKVVFGSTEEFGICHLVLLRFLILVLPFSLRLAPEGSHAESNRRIAVRFQGKTRLQ